MIKFLLLLTITVFFFNGCSSPAKKDLDKMLDVRMEQKLEDSDLSLPEIIITQKINFFLFPLFLALFVSIILIVSGLRAIGISVFLASVICIFIIITMVIYLKLIAIIGIGVLLVGIFFLGKNIYDIRGSQKELVDSVQLSKNYISEENKKELGQALTKQQSKYTRKIVREIKE